MANSLYIDLNTITTCLVAEEARRGEGIRQLNAALERAVAKVESALDCLQYLYSHSSPLAARFISNITGRLESLAETQLPSEKESFIKILNHLNYKNDPKLKDTISKLSYLLKDRFYSKSDSICRISFFGTRFSHHLAKSFGNLHTSSTKATTFVLSGAIFFTGSALLQDPKATYYIGGYALAGISTAIPIIGVVSSACGKEP